jgi:hypothetical protein
MSEKEVVSPRGMKIITYISENETDESGVPMESVIEDLSRNLGLDEALIEHGTYKLMQKGIVYQPSTDVLRATKGPSELTTRDPNEDYAESDDTNACEPQSLISKESKFQTVFLTVLDHCGVSYESEKTLGMTRRTMDIYIEETDTAIELKVDSSQRKGIGQALDYFQECTESVLLVPESRYDERVHTICEDAPITYATLGVDEFEFTLCSSDRLRFIDQAQPENLPIGYSQLTDIDETVPWGEDASEYRNGRERLRDEIDDVIQLLKDISKASESGGAPVGEVYARSAAIGMDKSELEHHIDKLKQKGEVYEPQTDLLRTT